jgi:peptidoglycan/LPS O-acetylase OafA/YrhL
MDPRKKDLRNDIIGLRALAVFLVLACHFQIPYFDFGFIGVDIFFVLSGYLITRVLYNEYLSSSGDQKTPYFISLVNFYLRRARRLLPAALVIIGLVNLMSFFISNPLAQSELALESKWALLLLANIAFLRSQSDYFQTDSEPSMLLHYWSLSVEEQFYIFWPLLFVLASTFQRFRFRGKFFRFNKRILVLIAICSIASFLFLQLGFDQNPNGVYFSIFTRAWELGVGGFFGVIAFHKKANKIYSRFERNFPFAIILLLTAFFIDTTNWARFIPFLVVAVAFYLYSGETLQHPEISNSTRLPRINTFILFIGKISYSLYLVHWPVYVLSDRYEVADQLWQRILLFPISVLLSFFLWKFVESPCQKIRLPSVTPVEVKSFQFLRTRPISVSFVSLLVVGGLYQLTYSANLPKLPINQVNSGGIETDPNMLYFANYLEKLKLNLDSNKNQEVFSESQTIISLSPAERDAWQVKQTLLLKDSLKARNLTAKEILAFTNLEYDSSPFEISDCSRGKNAVPPNCSRGDDAAEKRVALIGDSKMAHLAQPLIDYFALKGWRVEPMVLNGCKLSNPLTPIATAELCLARSKWVLEAVGTGNYDLIISSEYPDGSNNDYKTKYFTKIIESTKKLIIFQELTSLPYASECIGADYSFSEKCFQRNPLEKASAQISRDFERSLSSSKVTLIDMEPWVCVNGACPITVDETFIYRDGRHFTYSFIKKIMPYAYSVLDKVLQ